MFPSRIYYCRISDDRQDFLRQVNGLKHLAVSKGDNIPDHLWQLVLNKQPMPPGSPVLWDFGSRDMAEQRPNFQAVIDHIEQKSKARRTTTGLKEFCIYELDRFGVTDVDEWFHYRWLFNKGGCKIISALKGDLTAKQDLRTIIETLFEALNSTAEQKKTAGRVADQMAQLAESGVGYLGGVPRYGYDLGCFDGKKLRWRLHYRDATDRLQIIATDDNPLAELVEGAQTVEFVGRGNHPKKGKNQRYELVPSVDRKRVEGVCYLFETAKAQYPVVAPAELARLMALNKFTSLKGRSFDPDNLMLMLEDETYVGRRPYGKRSVARHKRYNKNAIDDAGRHLEDVPEDRKGKTVWREKADQILSAERTHTPLIEGDVFATVQRLLAARPKKSPRAPRSDAGWLKPVLYCAGCGRGMICRRFHGRQCYVCKTHANYRYQRPGDERFVCPAGLNSIRHDQLEAGLTDLLGGLEAELVHSIEHGVIQRLEEEVAWHEAQAAAGATEGFHQYLRTIWDALELNERPGQLGPLVERLLTVNDPAEQLAGVTDLERILPALVQQAFEQAEGDHRDFTKAIGRPHATPRQVSVWEAECRTLETRMEQFERLLVPYQTRVEQAAADCEKKREGLAKARQAFGESNNRTKGAAVVRLFSRILVHPAKGTDGKRIQPHLAWDEASLRIEVNSGKMAVHSLRNRCPSPLSSTVHGSGCKKSYTRETALFLAAVEAGLFERVRR
jgi:DNA invertase Pin-like site-specific DNA recombinase